MKSKGFLTMVLLVALIIVLFYNLTAAYYKPTHIVKKGECLWSITALYATPPTLWTDLYQENQQEIGNNPNLIFSGVTLVIPEIWIAKGLHKKTPENQQIIRDYWLRVYPHCLGIAYHKVEEFIGTITTEDSIWLYWMLCFPHEPAIAYFKVKEFHGSISPEDSIRLYWLLQHPHWKGIADYKAQEFNGTLTLEEKKSLNDLLTRTNKEIEREMLTR